MSKKNKDKEKEEDENSNVSIFIMMILLLVAIFIWNESNSNRSYEPSLQDVRDAVQIEVVETTIIATSTPFVIEVVPAEVVVPTLQPTIPSKQQFENALFSKDWVIVPLAYSHDTLQSCIEVAKSSPLLVSPKCLNYISFETDRCTNRTLDNYGLCEELP